MIIVEGPDNAGKTTLIRRLVAAEPKLEYLNRPRFGETKKAPAEVYLEALTRAHPWSIADRFLASELIYSRLFRGGQSMQGVQYLEIKAKLAELGAVVVFCDPGNAAILQTWGNRGQLYDSPLRIAEAYRENLPRIFYEFEIFKYNWQTDEGWWVTPFLRTYTRHINNLVEGSVEWPEQ